jgi:peptide/nickel transport system substrate-binding protein
MSKKSRKFSRREFLKSTTLLAGSAAAGSLLAACSTDEEATNTPQPEPTQAEAAPTQAPTVVAATGPTGTLIYGQAEPPTSAYWDDHTAFGLVDYQVGSLVKDCLWIPEEDGKLVPRLATEWDWVDEGTLEITLREGVKFHDGASFTAEDVKATIDRLSTDTSLAHNLFWKPVDVDVMDEYRVRISSDPPFGPLVPVLAATTMQAKAWIEDPDKFNTGNNGTGPYRFVDYKENKVTLEANEEYWDGVPAIKTIVFDYIEDWNARTNALLAGDVDVITRCSSEQLAAVEGNDNFYVYENSPAISVAYIYTRDTNPAMQNKNFRKALWYAIDRRAILEELMQGVGIYADSIIPTTALFYEPLSEAYEYNPDKAKELLDESGLSSSDLRISMATSTLVPHQKEIDQATIQWLNDVGIEVDVTTLEVGQFRTDWPQYDISLNTNGTPNGDPDFLLNFYAAEEGILGAGGDEAANGQEVVELHQKQRSLTDPDERQPAVTEVCEWLWDYQPVGVVSDELWPFILNDRVKNYRRNRTFGEALAWHASLDEM